MYNFLLHSPIFTMLLMVALAFGVAYINHAIWYIQDRRVKSSEASMDALDIFHLHDAAQPDDRDAEWLNEHERTCPKTLGGMSRDQGVPTMHRICPECKNLQRQLWGIHPIRTPQADVGDPDPHSTWDAALDEIKAWESKAALANIHTLHPERAA